MERASDYEKRREAENELLLSRSDLSIRRFFALDHDVYETGALPRKQKELMGLVASAVLRCDDCINYHLTAAADNGASDEEILESLGIALVVGGSITIPHLRHALAFLETIDRPKDDGSDDVHQNTPS
jgi:AhpD family alkylhydroperoxidase